MRLLCRDWSSGLGNPINQEISERKNTNLLLTEESIVISVAKISPQNGTFFFVGIRSAVSSYKM